jgi:hypothetical protein
MACAQFIPYPSGWSGYNSLCVGIRGLRIKKLMNPTQKCGNYIFLSKIAMYVTFFRENHIYMRCKLLGCVSWQQMFFEESKGGIGN